jgi:hypothetical protein
MKLLYVLFIITKFNLHSEINFELLVENNYYYNLFSDTWEPYNVMDSVGVVSQASMHQINTCKNDSIFIEIRCQNFKFMTGCIVNKKPVGCFKYYDPNENVIGSINYVNFKKNGRAFNSMLGSLIDEYYYINDKIEGIYLSKDAKGNIIQRALYKKNIKIESILTQYMNGYIIEAYYKKTYCYKAVYYDENWSIIKRLYYDKKGGTVSTE